MTEQIPDLVCEELVHILVHFADKGIIPEIVRVEPPLIVMQKAEGPRLGQFLRDSPNPEDLVRLYDRLGTHAGYISNYCVDHGHLHVDNVVVVHELNPVVIDWGMASYVGLEPASHQDHWRSRNAAPLLEGAQESLGSTPLFDRVQEAFMERFHEALLGPREKTGRELMHECFDRYGFI